MLAALGNALAVLAGKLLEQKKVLHQHRAARAGRNAVLVVGDRHAAVGGECRAFGHGLLLCCETLTSRQRDPLRQRYLSRRRLLTERRLRETGCSRKSIHPLRNDFGSIAVNALGLLQSADATSY